MNEQIKAKAPSAVENVIAALARRGRLTAKNVVDEARDEDSPLHPHFEWDDSIAGEAHRMAQARELIRSVRVSYVDTSKVVQVRPVYVHTPGVAGVVGQRVREGKGSSDVQGYTTIEDARRHTSDRTYAATLAQALGQVAYALAVADGLGRRAEMAAALVAGVEK